MRVHIWRGGCAAIVLRRYLQTSLFSFAQQSDSGSVVTVYFTQIFLLPDMTAANLEQLAERNFFTAAPTSNHILSSFYLNTLGEFNGDNTVFKENLSHCLRL